MTHASPLHRTRYTLYGPTHPGPRWRVLVECQNGIEWVGRGATLEAATRDLCPVAYWEGREPRTWEQYRDLPDPDVVERVRRIVDPLRNTDTGMMRTPIL